MSTSLIPNYILESKKPIALYGFAVPKIGQEALLKQKLVSFIEPTLKEEGVLAYEVHNDFQGSNTIWFYEKWASGSDLEKHLQQPLMQDFLAHRHELLSKDLTIQFLNPVSQ